MVLLSEFIYGIRAQLKLATRKPRTVMVMVIEQTLRKSPHQWERQREAEKGGGKVVDRQIEAEKDGGEADRGRERWWRGR